MKDLFKKEEFSGLQVMTNGIDASLYLNGEFLDKTPFYKKDITPGRYTLKIEPGDQNLASYETPITLNAGLLTVVDWQPGTKPETSGGIVYEMEKIDRSNIEVSFITIPDGAVLAFNSNPSQFAPVLLKNLQEGTYPFEVSMPSYQTLSQTINVVKGYRLNVLINLPKDEGYEERMKNNTNIEASASASLSVDSTQEEPEEEKANETSTKKSNISQTLKEADEEASETTALSKASKKVTILSTNFFKDGQEVLRVRDNPTLSGDEIGFVKTHQIYALLLQKSGWYKIAFDNKEGWISSSYAKIVEN